MLVSDAYPPRHPWPVIKGRGDYELRKKRLLVPSGFWQKSSFVFGLPSSLGTQLLQRVSVNGFKAVLRFPVRMGKGEKRAREVPAHGPGIPPR